MISLRLLLGQAIGLYQATIFVYVLLSWFAIGTGGPLYTIYRALGTVCEPFIGIFRRILPMAAAGGAGLDFSPLVALAALWVLQRLVYAL